MDKKCWRGCGKSGIFKHSGMNIKFFSYFGNSVTIPQIAKYRVTIDSEIPLLGSYSREMKNINPYKNLYAHIHSTLFIATKSRKNPNVHRLI
jgi:hypothetical protein